MENTAEEAAVRESESITERKRSRSLSPSDDRRDETRFRSICAFKRGYRGEHRTVSQLILREIAADGRLNQILAQSRDRT